jgi:hypothetical protein
MDAPTVDHPLYGGQPTQYVPPAQSPAAGWATQRDGYAPPPQMTWAGAPTAQSVFPASPAGAQALPTKRRRRWPWYLLLFLVIFGLVVAGGWVLLIRPAVHQSVDAEIRQGLQRAIDQVPALPPEAPAGASFPVTEGQINDYLDRNSTQLAPITHMQVALQPGVMVVTFQAYGFGSMVRLGLAVEGGTLVARNVDVSGLLWWVESDDDLTARLNDALSQIPDKLGHQLASVAIEDGMLQLTLA